MLVNIKCGQHNIIALTSQIDGSLPVDLAQWALVYHQPWVHNWLNPEATVLSISGDGGFQMCIQEIAVIAERKLPMKIIIVNNGALGMVRQWQAIFSW